MKIKKQLVFNLLQSYSTPDTNMIEGFIEVNFARLK